MTSDWPVERLVGVIDLMHGRAVAAVAGNRECYGPVRIDLPEFIPGSAKSLVEYYQQLGLSQIYIADLDALMGRDRQWEAIASILRCCQSLDQIWIDAGLQPGESTQLWNRWGTMVSSIPPTRRLNLVAASESLQQVGALEQLVGAFDQSHQSPVGCVELCLGLDYHAGQFRGDETPELWIQTADRLGIRQGLILDTAHVGTHTGPPQFEGLRRPMASAPRWTWTSGGGIRTPADVHSLMDAGFQHCLIATALQRMGWDSNPR
ncbi:MAG: HisA/HisF-related TIM barrel protein [Planctomycetota bacterium]